MILWKPQVLIVQLPESLLTFYRLEIRLCLRSLASTVTEVERGDEPSAVSPVKVVVYASFVFIYHGNVTHCKDL